MRKIAVCEDFALPYPREQIWDYFSNTEWLNRAMGLPSVHYHSTKTDCGGLVVRAEFRIAGWKVRWTELPFEWEKPRSSMVRREFSSGPIIAFDGGFELFEGVTPQSCQLRVHSRFEVRNRVGEALVKFLIHPVAQRKMRRAVTRLLAHLQTVDAGACRMPNLNSSAIDSGLLGDALATMRAAGCAESLLIRFGKLLNEVDDVEALRLRPFEIAKRWREPKWDVLGVFLHATRAGLVDLSWEVICPSCMEDSAPKSSLSAIHSQTHCPNCQIAYDVEFDRSVELKFSLNKSLRAVSSERFCLGGVNFRQDCLWQLTIAPFGSREIQWFAQPGRYFLRSAQLSAAAPFSVESGDLGDNSPQLLFAADGSASVRGAVSRPDSKWVLINDTPHPVTCRIERPLHEDEILTAAEVTNWQEFRDLFAREIVAPDERLSVGWQIFLFTDLRASTQLYNAIGDAPAYARVRDHFRTLRAILERHHGALVKTIGDAVMAVFTSTSEALGAAIEMQREVAALGRRDVAHPLQLKVAIHGGPCLAVNANGVLDYFGSTVNFAARLLSVCEKDEVVISDTIHQTTQARSFLAAEKFEASSLLCELRGLPEKQTVWKISTT